MEQTITIELERPPTVEELDALKNDSFWSTHNITLVKVAGVMAYLSYEVTITVLVPPSQFAPSGVTMVLLDFLARWALGIGLLKIAEKVASSIAESEFGRSVANSRVGSAVSRASSTVRDFFGNPIHRAKTDEFDVENSPDMSQSSTPNSPQARMDAMGSQIYGDIPLVPDVSSEPLEESSSSWSLSNLNPFSLSGTVGTPAGSRRSSLQSQRSWKDWRPW